MNRNTPYIYIIALLLLLGTATPAFAQTINGNVYGGGEKAQVDGSTNVTINAGKLGADIFGGGEGVLYDKAENGHAVGDIKASADISGATHVTINGGEFAVDYDDSKPEPKPFMEHYNVYGGGNIACKVGETHVFVTKGMVSNTSDGSTAFLDNDRFASGEAGMAQAYYKEGQMYFCIFGGGFGKNTSVMGNTWVDFNIGDGDGIQDISETAIEDDLLEYQSYLDVIGGGFNGAVQGNTNVHVGGNAMCRNVYGGGLYASIGTQGQDSKGKTNVHITGGNIDNVYGGGVMGDILTSTNVNIGLKSALTFDDRNYAQDNSKVAILMSVYGANDVSGHVPQANIIHNGGKIDQNIYGAGNGDYRGYYTPGVCDYADGENDNYFMVDHKDGIAANNGSTYKGRPQTDNVSITLGGNNNEDKAVVLGQVFGGGNSCTVGKWKTDLSSKYDGNPHAWRNDPEFFEGGGQLNISLNSHVTIGQDNDNVSADYKNADGENVSGLFMGASGSVLATQSDAANYHHYYDATAKQYKPGFSSTDGEDSFKAYLNNILVWSDDVNLTITGTDIWLANFVGGGFRGSMKRNTKTNFEWNLPAGVTVGNCIVGGAYNADVHYTKDETNLQYHGGLLQNDGTTFADVVLTLKNHMNGGEKARVFGGCFASGTVKNTQIDYYAEGAYDVYGGGALANLFGNSVVNLLGGSLTNAYGGGLGQLAADAVGTEGEPGYQPAKVAVEALVYGDATTTLKGSIVTGSIFGANNVNGTPKGHVKVHVLKTMSRGQANRNVTGNENNFDVKAVYGGGNKAAYDPINNSEKAEVLIENCYNSIAYVYGGGNAAPVPATDVQIYGADAIDNAFAGGNGAGQSTDPSAANYNPGADIGYKDYTRDEEHKYGSGETHITIYGGTINNVYGGSNTLGYIRTHAYVDIPETTSGCELHVGDVHAGGNQAEMFCGGSVTLACSEGADVVYAGANAADIHGDIDLFISSGTYGKVFGGNNQSGNVYGHINVTIDETGCWPVMIGELYACGNEAPYSVYGYNGDGSCKTSGDPIYKDPEINLISFTRIGKVFGGGYGEKAVVYGNPTVNVEPITGKFANWKDSENMDSDWHGTPIYILEENDKRVENTSEITITHGQIGSIGTIYGGGNKGAVYGNTNVLIGTKTTNKHVSGNDKTTEEEVAVTITGNVFGGGNEAIVSGDTKVQIGETK